MGVYTYTLRKTNPINVEGIGLVYRLRYLTRSSDHDGLFFSWDYGYKRSRLLCASIERTKQAFGNDPVYFVLSDNPKDGVEIRYCSDASKVSVWYDCNGIPGDTVCNLGQRVRRGRRLVWTTSDANPCGIPCHGCGKIGTTIFCSECAKEARCPHGSRFGECNACDVAGDLAYDSWRESR